MPDIDFTSAYRDATQGSTIKALGQRRAELQAAMAQRQPRPVDSPWQGAANVADVISGSIREGRMANQEAAGRQRFAELLKGGLTPDEAGEAYGLDPETTQKWMDRNWASEDLLKQHGWDVDKQTAEVKARQEEAAKLAETQAAAKTTEYGHEDTTAAKLAETQAAAKTTEYGHEDTTAATLAKTTAEEKRKEEDARLNADKVQAAYGSDVGQIKAGMTTPGPDGKPLIDQASGQAAIDAINAKAMPETVHPVTPDDAARWGGDVAKNPANYQISSKSGKPELINPSSFSPAEQEKRTYDTKSKITAIDGGLDELNRALEIAPDVTELGAVGREGYGLTGYVPESMIPERIAKTANATKRFDQIMQSNAIKRMAAELSGSDSDRDVSRFVTLMADPNSTLTQKKQMISSMIATLQRERGVTRDRLKGIAGEDAGEYKYTNPDVTPGDTGAPAATPAAPEDAATRKKKYNLEP